MYTVGSPSQFVKPYFIKYSSYTSDMSHQMTIYAISEEAAKKIWKDELEMAYGNTVAQLSTIIEIRIIN